MEGRVRLSPDLSAMQQPPKTTMSEAGARAERLRLAAMMGLFFLVVCAVGILRPIKNALALDGLGASDFYKVYLVSAVVIVFVPLFNRAADRFSWRWLLPGVALFFALNLVAFRLAYVEGSAAFGLAFYGWYDLFAAALVTQFFMATQMFFDARSAKRAYPLVIAGGSIGATLGGGITGFFAESLGTPNLLLVAAALIALFSLAMPWIWGSAEAPARAPAGTRPALERGELRTVFGNRQVQLIAATVLLTILVKQLVDFQFNALTKEVFETRDAVSAFQGKFNAATQWLPLVVLAGLRPALRRYGIGSAILLLPVCMVATTAGLAIAFGLWAAVAAKGAETSLRYSAERAGREMLYVPVPDDIKLKAKAYIDVAIEKGAGKVLSAVLLAVLLTFLSIREAAYVTVLLAIVWLALALAVRREYVRTLARAIDGRFASLRGLFSGLTDASSLPVLRRALDGATPARAGFTLELLSQAAAADVRPLAPELHALLSHQSEGIRARALDQLARIADSADEARLRERLHDDADEVREAAVRALVAQHDTDATELIRELLASDDARVRTAMLTHIVRTADTRHVSVLDRRYLDARRAAARTGDADARAELALAAGGMADDPDAHALLAPFMDDSDPRVRASALRSAALLGRAEWCDRMIAALAVPATRAAARDALVMLGERALEPLSIALLDSGTPARVRRAIPAVLAHIPAAGTVDALLRHVLAPETDQLLDYRSIKALSKLRARNPDLVFERALVLEVAAREADAANRYASAGTLLEVRSNGSRAPALLLQSALQEAWRERREGVFRCLGMLYPPHEVHRAYVAVSTGPRARRANALEWLEQRLGRETFRRLAAVFEPASATPPAVVHDLELLHDDGDPWVGHLARACHASVPEPDPAMELIEKVLLLQRVDLLQGARGAHVALLASIAEEVHVERGAVLIDKGEPPSALYVVTHGAVTLDGAGDHLRAGPEQAFGTWALIDESPSPLEARAEEPSTLLRITRTDFQDLLADHPELAVGLLQGLARRMRSLVA